MAQAESADVTGKPLRPGVKTHVYQHCVANKPPNPGRYRMLFEIAPRRRRLFRPGDSCHPKRVNGNYVPARDVVPAQHRDLIDWYHRDYRRSEHSNSAVNRSLREAPSNEATASPTESGGSAKAHSSPVRPRRVVPSRGSLDVGHGRRLYLVSCVKTKLPTPAPAKDLYVSPWFRKARACVERTGCPWAILSAAYGLLRPDEVIRPYEKTLKAMPIVERCAWAREVLESMDPLLAGIDTVVIFAGKPYRQYLAPALRQRGVDVAIPMLGLSQGRQLWWLNDCLRG